MTVGGGSDCCQCAGSRRCPPAVASSAGRVQKIEEVLVDGSYGGRLIDGVAERFKFCLEVVLHPRETRKFVLLPRRWVVERTFGWLNHSSRLRKSYERLTRTEETWIYIAMTRIMLKRLI